MTKLILLILSFGFFLKKLLCNLNPNKNDKGFNLIFLNDDFELS